MRLAAADTPKEFGSELHLVSCVSAKRSTRAKAKDLYVSPLFVKARAYVEKMGQPWFILSAQFGLVDPETVIPPYELTLNAMGVAARRAWASKVLGQLEPLLVDVQSLVFLAGQRYREHLAPALRERAIAVTVPMEGLRIGEQLSWLDRQLRS